MEERASDASAKFHRRALAVTGARELLLSRISPAGEVETELTEAVGRILAEDVRTAEPLPHFSRSGMDGYAVRSADTGGASAARPVELEVVQHIPCGTAPALPIGPGQAARIMTGAMVPEGADAVVMLEMTETISRGGRERVRLRKTIERGANVAPVGEEAARGDVVLRAGERIGAGQAALLAALGYARVRVSRKPVVAVVSTGTELLRIDEPLAPGRIRNSNAYMLAAQIASAGGEPRLAGAVPDDRERAERMIYDLLNADIDMLLTTGGVSVGDYDVMADIFLSWEGETLFNKVAMRPGSPTTAGIWRDKAMLGLSGNPSACFVGFELFARPAMAAMQGSAELEKPGMTAYLEADYLKVNGFARYVRGIWHCREGRNLVRPAGMDKSSELLSIGSADCLIALPPTKTGFKAGTLVDIVPLRGGMAP